MLKKAYDSGYLQHPIQQGCPLPALQYADDTLIILNGSVQQATFLKHILHAFTVFTGLQINFQKSTFVPMHMSDQSAAAVSQILGCPIAQLPCTLP
jgi:hypothetical protein